MNFRLPIFLAALSLLATAAMGFSGCAAADGESISGEGAPAGASAETELAVRRLAGHDVEEAHEIYTELASDYPDNGLVHAGKAVTELLLLPGSTPTDELVAQHLGGDASGLDAQKVVYGDNGYLQLVADGVPWVGSGNWTGIKGIIADRVPWDEEQLGALPDFVAGLDRPVDRAVPRLESLASRLKTIESDLQTALDDPEFDHFVLPGEVFYDPRGLTLVLGKSELSLIGAAVASSRGTLGFFNAYRHDWTLEEVFGPERRDQADSDDPDRSAWTAWDYSVDYLDGRFLRSIADDRRGRLEDARSAFQRALRWTSRSIELGLDSSLNSALNWESVEAEYARNLADFLEATADALASPTELPSTRPSTTAEFAPVFEDGRTLDEDLDWFSARRRDGDIRWRVTDAALQNVFVREVFDPPVDLVDDEGPTFRVLGERLSSFWDRLSGEIPENFRQAVVPTQ